MFYNVVCKILDNNFVWCNGNYFFIFDFDEFFCMSKYSYCIVSNYIEFIIKFY